MAPRPTRSTATGKGSPGKAKGSPMPSFRRSFKDNTKTIVAPSRSSLSVRVCCEAVGSNEFFTVLICYLLPGQASTNSNREPFSKDLEDAIAAQQFAHLGLNYAGFKRRSEEGDRTHINSQGYAWRCWPAIDAASSDSDDDGPDVHTAGRRMDITKAIADFLSHPDNNKYDISYVANHADDFTCQPPRHVSALLTDEQTLGLLDSLHPDLDSSFYSERTDYAMMWFGETGPYSTEVVKRLGFPDHADDRGSHSK